MKINSREMVEALKNGRLLDDGEPAGAPPTGTIGEWMGFKWVRDGGMTTENELWVAKFNLEQACDYLRYLLREDERQKRRKGSASKISRFVRWDFKSGTL